MSIFEKEETLDDFLSSKAENLVEIKGRKFEILPIGADTAHKFGEVCLEAFGPAISRLFENLDSMEYLSASEVKLGSEPLMLLGEALKNGRYSKAIYLIIKNYVKENGIPVDPEVHLAGQVSTYYQLQWLILKEYVINPFIDCMGFNNVDPEPLMQKLSLALGSGKSQEES